MKIPRYKSVGLFKRFILSYIIVLAVPSVILGLLIYRNILTAFSREVEHSLVTNLSQVSDVVNLRLEGLGHIAFQLPMNQNIEPILSSQNNEDFSEYEYHQLINQLRDYSITSTYIDNIYIYFRTRDLVVGKESKYTKDVFADYVYKDTSISKVELINDLNTISKRQISEANLESFSGNIEQSKYITYIQPIPITKNEPSATLIMTMDVSAIDKLIKNVLGNYHGNVYVLDSKGDIISSSLNNNTIPLDQIKNNINNGLDKKIVKHIKVNNCDNLMVCIKSSDFQWSYIAIVPSSQIYKNINQKEAIVFIAIFLCILIGIVLAYIFSYDNYHPIKQIAEMLTFNEKTASNIFRNELETISSAINSLIVKDKNSRQRIEMTIPVMQADFLLRLIRGDFSNENDIKETAEFSDIKFNSGPFATMIFNIDDYNEYIKNNQAVMHSVLSFALMNVSQELCESLGRGYAVQVANDTVAIIINFNDNNSELYTDMRKSAEKVIQFFKSHFQLSITVGAGSIYDSIISISESYKEAKSAVNFKIIKGKGSIVFFSEIKTDGSVDYYYSIKHEKKIIDCLRVGDFNGIHEVLSEIVESTMADPVSVDFARCIYFEIINTARKSLMELEPEDYNKIVQQKDILNDIVKCQTLVEAFQRTEEFYRNICDQIKNSKDDKKKEFKCSIINYIKDNYCDSNLSLSSLADKFSLSTAALSRFFSSETQYSFVEYLHMLRLNKAKQLLVSTDGNVADIAVECGYLESHSFIRSFKKYEGLTPGKYRELYKKQKLAKNNI